VFILYGEMLIFISILPVYVCLFVGCLLGLPTESPLRVVAVHRLTQALISLID